MCGKPEIEKAALTLRACTAGICNTVNKKGDYLKNYHRVDHKRFATESFGMILRLISQNGASHHETKNGG